MFKNLFTSHPKTVGENYFSHMAQAFSFGFEMFMAGLACLLHGFFPFLFEKTGSEVVRRLHGKMVVRSGQK